MSTSFWPPSFLVRNQSNLDPFPLTAFDIFYLTLILTSLIVMWYVWDSLNFLHLCLSFTKFWVFSALISSVIFLCATLSLFSSRLRWQNIRPFGICPWLSSCFCYCFSIASCSEWTFFIGLSSSSLFPLICILQLCHIIHYLDYYIFQFKIMYLVFFKPLFLCGDVRSSHAFQERFSFPSEHSYNSDCRPELVPIDCHFHWELRNSDSSYITLVFILDILNIMQWDVSLPWSYQQCCFSCYQALQVVRFRVRGLTCFWWTAVQFNSTSEPSFCSLELSFMCNTQRQDWDLRGRLSTMTLSSQSCWDVV